MSGVSMTAASVKKDLVLENGIMYVSVEKKDGAIEYALQIDGTWESACGTKMHVPIIEMKGKKKRIAKTLQGLRDNFGRRDKYNVQLHYCHWESEDTLLVALSTKLIKDGVVSRMELKEAVLKSFESSVDNRYWPLHSMILRIAASVMRLSTEGNYFSDVSQAIEEVEAEE